MTEWDHKAMEAVVGDHMMAAVMGVQAHMRRRVPFEIERHGSELSAGTEGLVAEYGTPDEPGAPWVFDGLRSFTDGRSHAGS